MPRMPLLSITRYWTPVALTAQAVDPFFGNDEDLYPLLRHETKLLAELAGAPCLFLLGEPALGKSTAIRQEVERLEGLLSPGETVLRRDLAEVSSDGGLDDLFA